MSYSKSLEARAIFIAPRVGAVISGDTTLRGPLMKYAGEIVGADVFDTADHTGDVAGNYFTIDVRANGNTAWTLNTGATPSGDINANTITFPTENATLANKRFASGEEITVVLTEVGTAVNFTINAGFYVWVIPLYDYNDG